MNILTHAVHTGYQFDLAKTGHQFYSLEIPGSDEVFWDTRSRPRVSNYHRLSSTDEFPVKMDLILAHFEFGYHCLKHSDLPLIYKEHCVREPFQVPPDWRERISGYSFASQTAALRWKLPAEDLAKVHIIGMGMDLRVYGGYTGQQSNILVVGQNIRSRGNEKGHDNILRLAQKFPTVVVGNGNDGIPGAQGPAPSHQDLIRHYQSHRIFLNPSNLLGMATLEAMATGMPVVSFRTINSDIIENGISGFIVDSVEEAETVLDMLLKDCKLAKEVGERGRTLISKRFRPELFIQKWNALFEKAVREQNYHLSLANRRGWVLDAKPYAERDLAIQVVQTSFEYCRVGFEKRPMRFQPNGRVGKGAGGCELFWDVKIDNNSPTLEIYSGSTITCRLKPQNDGKWVGQWLVYEKMPIILSPIHP